MHNTSVVTPYQIKVSLSLLWAETRDEYLSCLSSSSRSPFDRIRYEQYLHAHVPFKRIPKDYLLPVDEARDDLESLGYLTRLIRTQPFTNI